MKAKQAILLAIIVLVPLAMIAWLGVRIWTAEREIVRHQVAELLTARLRDSDQVVAALIGEREREMSKLCETLLYDADSLRGVVRTHPLISQICVIDAEGKIVHPPIDGELIESEREFLRRARRLLIDQELTHGPAGTDSSSIGAQPGQGWRPWYWENGLSLIFWRRMPDGRTIAIEMERSRWMADIVAKLPNGDADGNLNGSMALLDSNGATVYRWGGYQPPAGQHPGAEIAMSPPLTSWHLQYFSPQSALGAGSTALWTLLIGLTAAGALLLALGISFYVGYARDLRDSARRVNFVNQVSHELKTPLTNIRMYAELLEQNLPQEQGASEQAQRYMGVIVSESQRLSRLIGNVLTFARQQRQALTLHRQSASVDAVIDATIEQFRPALDAAGIAVDFQRGAAKSVLIDADAVGQIMGNLISNVEKYAAAGKKLSIVSTQQGGRTAIRVADLGGGIPESHRDKIFQPFYRVSNELSDGVTGTGIGLSIARELARQLGGDVILERSDRGACFCVTFAAPDA